MSRRPSRQCRNCGAPSAAHALCGQCNSNKKTRPHVDRYAELEQPNPQPQDDRSTRERDRHEKGLSHMTLAEPVSLLRPNPKQHRPTSHRWPTVACCHCGYEIAPVDEDNDTNDNWYHLGSGDELCKEDA